MGNYNDKKSFVYIWNGHILFARYGMDNEFHSHHAAAVVIGIDSEFYVETENSRRSYRSALITPDTYHRTIAENDPLAILLLDPEVPEYEAFTAKCIHETIMDLDFSVFNHLRDRLMASFNGITDEAAWHLYRDMLAVIDDTLKLRQKIITDQRILKIAMKIKRELPDMINIDDLSGEVSLSGDRIIRLFREQMGIPLRRYLLWTRLRATVEFLKKGHSLTDTAHEAGFSDSAHMSRTFKENFGFTPSDFFSRSSNVEIHFCDDRLN